jgi:hypothetical protein
MQWSCNCSVSQVEDACALLGTTFQWTGSEKSIPADMVNAFDAAVSSKADGIALALIDPNAFNEPVEKALADINTGLKFVTKTSVDPYLNTQSRFEGSSNEEKVLTRSGPIS